MLGRRKRERKEKVKQKIRTEREITIKKGEGTGK